MAHGKTIKLGNIELNRGYMLVWVALLVLTIVEVIVPEPTLIGLAKFPRTFEVLSLIFLALIKTIAVAWFYMHLVDERRGIIAIACAPFVFSIFLTVGLFPYSFSSSATPDSAAPAAPAAAPAPAEQAQAAPATP